MSREFVRELVRPQCADADDRVSELGDEDVPTHGKEFVLGMSEAVLVGRLEQVVRDEWPNRNAVAGSDGLQFHGRFQTILLSGG